MGRITTVGLVLGTCGCGDGSSTTADGGFDADTTDQDAGVALDANRDVFVPPKDAGKDVALETGPPKLSCGADPAEPNESEVLATPLGQIDDCDSSGSSWSDVSSGTGDIDWIRFRGKDTFGCIVNPTVQIDTTGLRLCAFAMCLDGTTTLQACNGGSSATSPAGTKGCCTTTTSSMDLSINCSGIDDSADIFIRVDQPNTNDCVAYDVSYHY